jgi:hypothetical protein
LAWRYPSFLPIDEILVAVHHSAGDLFPADAPSVTLGAQPLKFDPEFLGGFNFGVERFEFREGHCSISGSKES